MIKRITTVLESSFMYRAHMRLLGGRMIKRKLLQRYLPVVPGLRVLDIGCGPAPDRDLMGDIRWTGLELNERYVKYVRQRLRSNDRIIHGDVASTSNFSGEEFDVILLSGVVHHLSNDQVESLLRDCSNVVAPQGFILTIDPVRTSGASWLERYLIDLDRGEFIRGQEEYDHLVPTPLHLKDSSVHHGLGWLPQATRTAILTL